MLATQISSHGINILQKLLEVERMVLCYCTCSEKFVNFDTILNVLQVSLVLNLTLGTEVIRKF